MKLFCVNQSCVKQFYVNQFLLKQFCVKLFLDEGIASENRIVIYRNFGVCIEI